jgi:hypothetical protein
VSDSSWASVVLRALERMPLVLILLGAAFVVLGLTDNSWLPMTDPTARLFSGTLGTVLLLLGIVWSRSATSSSIRPADYGIKITYPLPGDQVDMVDVQGSITRDLPPNHCLRVFRIYPDDKYVPLTKARIDLSAKTWIADRCSIGGMKGDKRSYAAYIVGESGEALIDFHNAAVAVHRKTIEQLKDAKGPDPEYLPAVSARTKDMYECSTVRVVRS